MHRRIETRTPSDIIEESRSRRTPTFLKFPQDIGLHGIVMNFREYDYNRLRSRDVGAISRTNNSVTLPLPQNLQNNLQIKVQGAELGTMASGVLDAINAGGGDPGKALKDSLSGTYNTSQGIASALKDAIGSGNYSGAISSIIGAVSDTSQAFRYMGRSGIDRIMPGIGLAFDITSQTAINPHMTVDFDGVNLKRHNFEWTLSPKSMEESEDLRNIINLISRNSLPRYQNALGSIATPSSSVSRGLLTYPSIVDLFFVGVDPSYFWYFKPCMVANISTNFTSQGLSINKGGRPSVITLQIEFQESIIHTADDYGNAGGRLNQQRVP